MKKYREHDAALATRTINLEYSRSYLSFFRGSHPQIRRATSEVYNKAKLIPVDWQRIQASVESGCMLHPTGRVRQHATYKFYVVKIE